MGTMGGTLALKVRKVLEITQKKSGGSPQCCTLWDYESREHYVSLPLIMKMSEQYVTHNAFEHDASEFHWTESM